VAFSKNQRIVFDNPGLGPSRIARTLRSSEPRGWSRRGKIVLAPKREIPRRNPGARNPFKDAHQMDELNPKCVLKDWFGADLATTAACQRGRLTPIRTRRATLPKKGHAK